jgi:hypothetical protein
MPTPTCLGIKGLVVVVVYFMHHNYLFSYLGMNCVQVPECMPSISVDIRMNVNVII